VIAAAREHPGSDGGYSGQRIVYDVMGRAIKTSNPTETTATGTPFQWNTDGDDESAGWIYTEQTYDWKGRPLVTTNQDGTTKTISYTGCGCAGGQVATLTDEGTIDSGTAKRRQKKIYSDVLGRTRKTEFLNWQGGSIYSARVNSYNVRNQITQVRHYAGPEGSGSFLDTTVTYDGYGRVKTNHVPEQEGSTVLTYNADDTISTVTDARGAMTTYGYNNRHLLASISYSAPAGIVVPAPVTFTYDAAGNRTSTLDGSGSTSYQFDQLSRITSEAHDINGLAGTQSIGYTYTLTGQLSSLTDPLGRTVSYAYDSVGMLSSITGSGYTNASQFANNFQYRAWGAVKHFNIGFDWWNGTSSLTPADLWYNSRLQLSHFKLAHPNTAASPIYDSTYQYYADGKPKFISNVRAWSIQEGWPPTENMHQFDRAYRYDHLGRLTQGLTGDEARGGTTPDGPYNESYQYDTWHNMTQRTNRIWSKPIDVVNLTYVNNRKQGFPWQYDADGNETSEATFDAAGRKAGFWTYLFLALGQGPFRWYEAQAQATYDGNGGLIKEQDSIDGTTYMTVFYVRSAVLGGEPIMMVKDEPFNGPGTVTRTTSIYGNGARIGLSTDGYVRFEHSEPLTGRRTGASELDPLGQEVGSFDPGPEESGDVGQYQEPHEFGNVEDPSMGCTLDGINIDCGTATRLLNTGAVGLAGASNKVVTDPNGERIFARNNPTEGELILGHFWEWVDDRGKKPTGQPVDDPKSDVARINGWIPRGHWGEVFQVGQQVPGLGQRAFFNPQDPVPQPHPTPTPPVPKNDQRSEWQLNKCDLEAFGKYLPKETVTLLKQTAANAGIGLAVLAALFFAAEAAEAYVGGATVVEWVVSGYVKLESATRALAFGEAALILAVKTYGSLVKESFNNKKEFYNELRDCAAKHAPLDGPWGWLMNPKYNPLAPTPK
jgi:YD repeat-containing protein